MNATTGSTESKKETALSAWAPLRRPTFLWIWLAMLVSNLGGWVQDTTSAWVMTTLTPSPLLVSLVEAADQLPVLMLVLVAGALADTLDRRRFILFAQVWMLLASLALALLTYNGSLNPDKLLLLTFLLGVGEALAMPALAATTPELVPVDELPAAVALGAISINVARSIGPAIGGAIVARWGAAAAYAINAASFIGVIVVFALWRRNAMPSMLPAERFLGAVRGGISFTRGSPEFRGVLIRAAAFFLFANANWPLLPVIAKTELGGGPGTYGLLLGAVGVGAVIAAIALPSVRHKLSRGTQVVAGTLLYSATSIALAWIHSEIVLVFVMLLSGAAWITVLSALQVSAQTTVPSWVRARTLSIYIMVFAGSLFVGSTFWGWVATRFGVSQALTAAAISVAFAGLLSARIDLKGKDPKDLMPSAHWPQPIVVEDVEHDRGPVMVTIAYQADLKKRSEFLEAMDELGRVRRRDGAIFWGVFEDVARPGHYLEMFSDSSWLEHLREHERVSHEVQRAEERVIQFLVGDSPLIQHYIGGKPSDSRAPALDATNCCRLPTAT